MTPDLDDARQPPVAARRPVDRAHHGDVVVDDYEWLRDKTDPEVISHLEAENAYTAALTEHLEPLVETLFGELKDRTQETDLSVPVYVRHRAVPPEAHGADEADGPDAADPSDSADGGDASDAQGSAWWYYTRTQEGAEYARFCRAPALDRTAPPSLDGAIPGETVYLDANVEASGHEFFDLGALAVSPGGHLLAYSTDVTGAERYTLRVRDLRTGEDLADTIPDVSQGACWAGETHVFYTRCDEAWRPYVVLRHRLDTSADDDAVVLTEPDERFWLGVDTSRDDQWLVFGSESKLTSEYRLLAADDPEGTPRVVAPRRQGVEYSVEPAGDRLLVVHNDGAEDFALAQAPLDATSHTQWVGVLDAQPGVRLLGVDAYASHVVVALRRDGLSGLHVLPRDPDGDLLAGADVAFEEPLFTVGSSGGPEYATPSIRVDYTSMLTPSSVYDYDLASGRLTLLKQTAVLASATQGPYDAGRYVQERSWATAADGARVPMSIVRRADVPLDGSAPALLYGYGSYEISIDPTFSVARLSLLDRGVVFAIAHVRGGGELGRAWYDQGKVLTKWNTFADFAACADHLVEAGYTSPDRLAARGGSAGGLLMGVVANAWPQKFRAVHAQVPFVDALTTILDPDLPLTVTEWEEWGDPLHDADVYAYMKSYTPYENVADQEYPAILATTSLNDTRVFYVEPAKWVAALRAGAGATTRQPVLLKTEMVAGHGGVSGRYAGWREVAFANAWVLDQIAADPGPERSSAVL